MVTKTLITKGFLFDLDGTLIDTTPQVVKFWTNLAIANQLDPEKILETSHGRRTIETLKVWMPHLATPENVSEMEGKMALEMEGVCVLPGVLDLIKSIDVNDWTINTAGTYAMASIRLEQFGIPLPKEMSTGDRLVHGKPHPEGYLKSAQMIHQEPKDCVVFEDAPAGVKAAVAAGIKCIACVTTHTVDQLKEAGATIIVDSLSSVQVKKLQDGGYEIIINDAYDF